MKYFLAVSTIAAVALAQGGPDNAVISLTRGESFIVEPSETQKCEWAVLKDSANQTQLFQPYQTSQCNGTTSTTLQICLGGTVNPGIATVTFSCDQVSVWQFFVESVPSLRNTTTDIVPLCADNAAVNTNSSGPGGASQSCAPGSDERPQQSGLPQSPSQLSTTGPPRMSSPHMPTVSGMNWTASSGGHGPSGMPASRYPYSNSIGVFSNSTSPSASSGALPLGSGASTGPGGHLTNSLRASSSLSQAETTSVFAPPNSATVETVAGQSQPTALSSMSTSHPVSNSLPLSSSGASVMQDPSTCACMQPSASASP